MEESRRRTTSVRQIELLVDFMEAHRDLALGRVRSKEARALAARLWEQCAEIINSEGANRTPKEWSRFWNDYKCRVRSKLSEIRRISGLSGINTTTVPELSPLEDRVASLIGRDAGALPGVRIDPPMDPEVNFEDQEVEETVIVMAQSDSPNIDFPIMDVENRIVTLAPQSPDHRAAALTMAMPETPAPEETQARERIEPACEGSTLPHSSAAHRNRASTSRPRERRHVRPRAPTRSLNQENVTALDDARASIARIEEMRARTEETLAAASLRQAEAAIKQSEAMASMAHSVQIIAESVQGYLAELRRVE